ncbi:MAG: hypothetical protein ACT452_10755 [Microthrixaceae bacterium]
MTDQPNDQPAKTPAEAAVEHAVETFIYAPIGLLFEGASLLPQLVEKGRNQVTMARMIGKFALEQGKGEATKAATKLGDQAAGVLDFIGGSVTPTPTPTAPAAPARTASAATRPSKAPGAARAAARKVAGVATASAAPKATTPKATTAAAATPAAAAPVDLAIPDYDGLSASHVVNRLAGLSSIELEAVRQYEAANRGRKTILSKVAQLQAS